MSAAFDVRSLGFYGQGVVEVFVDHDLKPLHGEILTSPIVAGVVSAAPEPRSRRPTEGLPG